MTHSRLLRRLAASILLGCCALGANLAAAEVVAAPTGFRSLPSFAWPTPAGSEDSRWAGSYARISSGFEVSSSKRFGSYAGPTVGFEGGRMWQDGSLIYGIVGGFGYLHAIGGGSTPGFGGIGYSRDFSGALQLKVGTLLTPDVLVYAKAGASAVHEKLQSGPTSASPPFARENIAVRPDARVGVEWAVTDRLTVGLEASVFGPGIH